MPIHSQKGLDNHAEADPVMAKTMKMIVNWKLDVTPQRCLNLFMIVK